MTVEAEEAGRHRTSFATRKILVIDDEQRLAQSLASLLRGCGYNVDAVYSGQDGVHSLQSRAYDLVITDLRMDGVDGFDIMNFISHNCPNTALIVITGHASMHSAIEALHQRAADYITKPFDFEVLQSSIERVLAQQQAEQLRRDMINMLTHDIKVPLTNILGFAQLIGANAEQNPALAAKQADIITLNCQKLLLMLDNYLTNARLEAGRLETACAAVDLREVIEEGVAMLLVEFEKKSINLEFDLADLPEVVVVDETLISRAFCNLISNAAKYTGQEETVRISAAVEDDMLVLRVMNTGASMTDEECRDLFDRYRRASTSRGTDGAGLGLHIVRSVAEAHGGRAWCEITGDEISFCIAVPAKP
jgi:signal transduction histidine kinase